MSHSVSFAELREATGHERERLLSELIEAAYQPPNGEVESLDRRIREYELRYEVSSKRMREELSNGTRKETAEICDWLMLLHLREQVGEPA